MTKVFINCVDAGGHTDAWVCHWDENGNQSLASFIEEQLYILQELSPRNRDWRYELIYDEVTTFHYCDQMVKVTLKKQGDAYIVTCMDIEG